MMMNALLRDMPKAGERDDHVVALARKAASGGKAAGKPMMELGDAMAHLQKARRECIDVGLEIAGRAVSSPSVSTGAGLSAPCLFDEVRATAREIHAVAAAIEDVAAALRAQL